MLWQRPQITETDSSIDPVGAPVTLTGTEFGTAEGIVYWTQGHTALQSIGSALNSAEVRTTIPRGLTPGPLTVAVYRARTGCRSLEQPIIATPSATGSVSTRSPPEKTPS